MAFDDFRSSFGYKSITLDHCDIFEFVSYWFRLNDCWLILLHCHGSFNSQTKLLLMRICQTSCTHRSLSLSTVLRFLRMLSLYSCLKIANRRWLHVIGFPSFKTKYLLVCFCQTLFTYRSRWIIWYCWDLYGFIYFLIV